MPPAAAATERFAHELMSGRRRGPVATLLRGALRAAEAPYSLIVRARNRLYDRGLLRAHRLPVPVVCVGNITAGGTGKTPVVRFLFRRLREAGMNPAVLMRGYKRVVGGASDEQVELAESLSVPPRPPAVVHADADRVAGGRALLAAHPDVDLILLDDGFQHRRLARQFDLVVIDATRPFGYGHVHPRGMLREPLEGLRRADAFILTRSDLVDAATLSAIDDDLRALNPSAPAYPATHAIVGLRSAAAQASAPPDVPLAWLEGRAYLAAAGIGNPEALERQLKALPGRLAAARFFADHHAYSAGDVAALRDAARSAGAEVVVVTEKDWGKLRAVGAAEGEPRFLRLALELRLRDDDAAAGLVDLVLARIEARTEADGRTPGA